MELFLWKSIHLQNSTVLVELYCTMLMEFHSIVLMELYYIITLTL